MHVETPSGLSGTVRKLRGAEINLLSDRTAIRSGTVITDILKACWVSTDKLGPYAALDWQEILTCDRFFALVMIRMASYGSEFVFPTRCGESGRGGCGHRFDWAIDLKTDLLYYPLPDESRAKIKAGDNKFETEVMTDNGPIPVFFKLSNGRDEEKSSKLAARSKGKGKGRRNKAITTAIAQRITRLGDHTSTAAIASALDDIDFDEQLTMLEAMDECDGGFETKIDVQCEDEDCGNVYGVNLPFEGETFWTPRRSTRGSVSRTKPKRKARAIVSD